MQHFHNGLLIFMLLISACTGNQKEQHGVDTTKAVKKNLEVNKPVAQPLKTTNKDTLIVQSPTAICYEPDSAAVEKRKKEMGEDDFYVMADDNVFYMSTARDDLKKQNIKTLEMGKSKVIKFVMPGNKYQIVRIDTIRGLWGIYLFRPGNKPYNADITMMHEEIVSYFNK